jgi:hypothetical protein
MNADSRLVRRQIRVSDAFFEPRPEPELAGWE